MDNIEHAIYQVNSDKWLKMPPTRICQICDLIENPESQIVNAGIWICPECKKRLQKLLYPERKNERDIQEMG